MTRRRSRTGTEGRFEPFADDAAVCTLGGLSFENGRDRIALHGSLDLTRDRAGLALARDLQRTAAAIVAALESAELPERIAPEVAETPIPVKNPFT